MPPLAISKAFILGGLIAFEIGCDNSPKDSSVAVKRNTAQQTTGDAPAVPIEEQEQAAKPTEAASKTPIAPQVDTKLPEAPLDPTVDVEKLLASRFSVEELSVGWIRLFDGQSLMGWRNAGNADWKVEEGELVATTGKPGLLVSSVRFSDFELMLEYKGENRTNSGVFLRTPPIPTDPAKDCFEFNIAPPDNAFPSGSLVGRAKVSDQVEVPEPGEWHTLHAMVDREHIQTWVNGQMSADYTDTTGLTAGFIGLQFREGTIRFRNVKVRPISYAILPAKDLKDFNTPAGEVKAELTADGSLSLKGGKGRIELLQPHANGCFQIALQTLAENANSGFFFRCIPGEELNGYECQIHHGYQEDRRRPVDAGMGAIFRRQSARAVLSDWADKTFVTVIADGPFMSTWVNGVQVVDWQDTRKPDENPRKGLRIEAGTIMLQSHDAECNVRFDSLGICPLP
jgi:hypothetical protein